MTSLICWSSHQAFAQCNFAQTFHQCQIMLLMSDYVKFDMLIESSGLCAMQFCTNMSPVSDNAVYEWLCRVWYVDRVIRPLRNAILHKYFTTVRLYCTWVNISSFYCPRHYRPQERVATVWLTEALTCRLYEATFSRTCPTFGTPSFHTQSIVGPDVVRHGLLFSASAFCLN